jgi:hypothetical protein
MSECYLKGHGDCSDQLSGEHYISASVLRMIAPDGFVGTAGYAWQKPNTFQGIGINSLQSKILCTHHNSGLSDFDEEAKNFIERVFASTKSLDELSDEADFDGEKIERWMLKTLLSMSASGGLDCAPLADRHKEILLGAPWPEGWGLYARADPAPTVATPDLRISAYPHPVTRELMVASFLIAEVEFWLLLHKPEDPQFYGVSRPRGFIYKHNSLVRTINLLWPNGLRNLALSFTRIGISHELPPHLQQAQQQIKPRKGR